MIRFSLLSKVDLVLFGDVLSAPGPEIVDQTAFAHVLGDQTDVLVVDDQAEHLHQILVPQRCHEGRLGKELLRGFAAVF